MSNAEPRASGASYRMLRELGARAQQSYAAIREPNELVVAQRFVRVPTQPSPTPLGQAVHGVPIEATSMALLLRDARCLAKNWHPNIGRVRYVDLAGGELTIASDLLDGATLADLYVEAASERTSPRDPPLPLPILVRILLDVLGGLNALHGLRDGLNAPLGAMHGELCPSNIIVGKDGVARIIDVLRPRPVRLEHPSAAAGYAAPEVLDAGGTDDARADVYAVGVILWEALAARRLHDETDPARVLARQREEEIAAPSIHLSSPFARLVDVAMRALAFDPALRFRGATEMAAELRKIAGPRLAAGSVVAARVADLVGERIRTRRALLDPALSGTRRRASEKSIVAAAAVVRKRESDRDLADAVARESDEPNMLARPALSPPAAARAPRVRRVKASPRVVAPTVKGEVSVALLAASRDLSRAEAADDSVVGEWDVETVDDDTDEDLPGPRGSSPDLDLEAALEAFEARTADETETPPSSPSDVSPVTPNVPFPSRREIERRPVVQATGAVQPAGAVPAAGRGETPGELVVPVPASIAAPARRRLGALLLTLTGVVVLLAAGGSIALRMHAAGRTTLSRPPAPVVAVAAPAPALTDAVVLTPTARPNDAPPGTTPLGAPATPPIGAPASRAVPHTPAVAPPPERPSKPKRSLYDPDGL